MKPTGIKHIAMRTLMSIVTGACLASSALYGTPLTFIYPTDISPAAGYTISKAGLYVLVDDATHSTATAIIISADNVTLDLNGKKLIGSGGADTGIDIPASRSNIIIQNGTITGFDTNGVKAATGGSTTYTNIELQNLTIRGIAGSGIAMTNVFEATIENCVVDGNVSGGTLSFCNDCFVKDSHFDNNFSSGLACFGLQTSDCEASMIKNCTFNGNSSASAAVTGFSTTGTGNIIEDCIANGNFNFAAASSVVGMVISGSGHVVTNCRVTGNVAKGAGTSTAVGFSVSSTGHQLVNCNASHNRTFGSGKGTGFLLNTVIGGVGAAGKCLVKNCTAISNSSYGFRDDNTFGNNFFIGNSSFGHGASTDNYFAAGGTFPYFEIVSSGATFSGAAVFDTRQVTNLSFIIG